MFLSSAAIKIAAFLTKESFLNGDLPHLQRVNDVDCFMPVLSDLDIFLLFLVMKA